MCFVIKEGSVEAGGCSEGGSISFVWCVWETLSQEKIKFFLVIRVHIALHIFMCIINLQG